MCDTAYVLQREQLERQVLAERLVAATYNASGNFEQQDLPDLGEALERFDAALVYLPSAEDLAQRELLDLMRGRR